MILTVVDFLTKKNTMLTIPQAWAWRTKQKLRPSSQSSVEFLRFAMRKTVRATVKQMQGTKKSATQRGKIFAYVKQNLLRELVHIGSLVKLFECLVLFGSAWFMILRVEEMAEGCEFFFLSW